MARNEPQYLPDPIELWRRAEIVQWMTVMEWSIELMDAVMLNDEPSPETVRRLVWQHGPIKAEKILLSFLD